MPLSRAAATTGASVIKSIQRGLTTILSFNLTQDITVTAVDMAKSVLNLNGQTTNSGATPAYNPRILLTSPTTITISRGAAGSDATVSWELVEYN